MSIMAIEAYIPKLQLDVNACDSVRLFFKYDLRFILELE